MKITRYKKVQKYLRFYYNNYGFHQPYQVLLDGTFCFAAFKEQINIREQIPKYLNSQAKLLTTRCIIMETEKIAKKTHGALTILKQFGIHECGHKEPIAGSSCILSMIGKRNDKHYILATQDRDLQDKLREKAGVPLLYLHNKSPTLEKPSKISYSKAGQSLEGVFITETQNEALQSMKKVLGLEEKVEEPKIPIKKKKPHNPNPLSCKKKKKKPVNNKVQKESVSEGKVRKRKKKKLPQHLKEQLKTAVNG
ncbi:rRNA-processing protein UTP23 homolog [Anticarsia gemmatalis]|uniref:rRNA-processing protein UTP23 homolog n=1 Tax=Anticarsia gemmatalis TaxID=129554 RepID=UPI003F76E090